MAVNDLYQVVDEQTLFGQQVLNVYYYQQVSEGTADDQVQALADAFYTSIQVPMFNLQSAELLHVRTRILNTDDTAEFGNIGIGQTGLITGDCLPPFVSFAFRWNRVNRAVRNGQKRIAGVPESEQNNGVATSGALVLLAILAGAMMADITDTVTSASFRPRIVHRSVPGIPIYTAYPVGTVEYSRISSQNTRKFGRGA